jgi:glutaryl-CoA dehydrogenase
MEDFLKLDSLLQAEEIMARESVKNFVRNEAEPLMMEAFEKAEFPNTLIKGMADLGLFGMTLPEAYGGAGASQVAYGLVCQELERGDSALRSFVSVQSSLCMYPIYAYGNETQKQHYLPKMAKGEWIGCFGLTEPDSGSDPASMQTKAQKVEGGYLLNGAKIWITNAPMAHLAIVWAKINDKEVRGFIVERDFKGFKTPKMTHKGSLRASLTGEIILENCFVPETHLLPGSEIGLQAALACLTKARYGIAWGAMGAAMACYEAALRYTQERIQFQKPLASFQLIQKDLVDMFNEIVKAQSMNLQLGRLHDQEQHNYVMVSLAKMNACREALKIARMSRNLLGANGISLEYSVIRHMMNLESVFTYEGTDNMHHLIVGRYLTGLSAFA